MNKMVLASGNSGKLAELAAVLAHAQITLVRQTDLGIIGPEETGLSFIENALIKARHAAEVSSLPAIADDSGLCVDCLQGAPGIYSSRYGDGSDAGNRAALLDTLKTRGDGPWPAHFHCTLVVVRTAYDPDPIIAQARWDGLITAEHKGSGGFGYDPIFFCPEQNASAAELDPELKNRISHRAKAAQRLLAKLRDPLT
jgi:XTP/dITP diphosphohydrolase